MDINTLSSKFNLLKSGHAVLNSKYSVINSDIKHFETEIVKLQSSIDLYKKAKELYASAVEIGYNSSLKELEDTINLGLNYIFYDKSYKIRFEISTSRNKTLILYKEDLDKGTKTSLKRGSGAGVRSIVSFVLLVYYILAKNSYPIVFLDESYSEVSSEYIERFFIFIQSLCKSKSLKVVMITHDERFINYADKTYRIADGEIILEV